jgi:hypothetical protein
MEFSGPPHAQALADCDIDGVSSVSCGSEFR